MKWFLNALAVIVVSALAAACGSTSNTDTAVDDVGDVDTPSTQPAEPASVADAEPADATGACNAELPADATDVSTVVGDLDGNGVDDQLSVYAVGDGPAWYALATLDDGGGAVTEVLIDPDFADHDVTVTQIATTGPLAGVGAVSTFVGANGVSIALVSVQGCELGEVRFESGEVARFRVGGGASPSRLTCLDTGLRATVAEPTSVDDADIDVERRYEVTHVDYRFDAADARLVEEGSSTEVIELPADDAVFEDLVEAGGLVDC